MGEFNWQQTVAQAAKGDKNAFEMLYKQTERSVYFTCLKLLGNEHDAKDVMQDTYIKAFEKLSELSDYSKFQEWINRIAINRCKTLFKKQKPDYLEDKPEQVSELIDESEIIPSDYVSDAEKRRIIMNIIDTQLSDLQRHTVILYYYDEMSVAQIAEIMECPEGTVKYRLSAAREKIREAVLIYEKENDDKLHAIIPIPVLTSILRKEAEEIAVPKIQLFKPEAPAPKQGTGNNSNLSMKGQNAMTNAIKGKIIAGVAAAVIVGGGVTAAVVLSSNSDKPDKSDNTSSVSKIDNTSSIVTEDSSIKDSSYTNDPSAADIEDSELEDEGKFFDWRGINTYIPPGFEGANIYARRIFKKELDTGTTIYLDFECVPDYGRNHGTDTYEFEDVPEILKEYIISDMSQSHFDIGNPSTFIPNIVDEQVELLGTTFNHQTGKIDVIYCGVPAGEMYYSVYYGLLDDGYGNEKVPFSWICYSDDESTLDELASVVELVAEKASWIEE